MDYWLGLQKSPRESIEKGIEMAQKALAMDDSIASAHGLLSDLYTVKREYDKAIAEGERAVALDPGGADAHEFYAMSLVYAGRSEEAIPIFQKAIRLNPLVRPVYYLHFGHAFRMRGGLRRRFRHIRKHSSCAPDNIFAHIGLAAAYIMMGREKEARAEAAEVLRINPKFSVDSYAKSANL